MRKIYALVTAAVCASASIIACGSDDDDDLSGGTSGKGGTGTSGTGGAATGGSSGVATGGSTSGGTAGTSTSGGTAGTSTSGGTAGTSTSGGTAGTSSAGTSSTAGAGGEGGGGTVAESCSGCARLSVPLMEVDSFTQYQVDLGDAVDLSAATITFHVCRVAGSGGVFQPQVSEDSGYTGNYDGGDTNIADIMDCNDGFEDIVFTAAGGGGSFPATSVTHIGIQIHSGNVAVAWTNPTVIYVDSITVAGGPDSAGPFNFAADLEGWAMNIYNGAPGGVPIVGSTITWQGP